jgi:hypothetical protein
VSDEFVEGVESGATSTFSRRNALKAGVAGGVGLAAWSGATITSLGGTPAYAAGCTFITNIDLSGGCRNTDQGNTLPCGPLSTFYGYHPIKDTGLPAGYTVTDNIAEHTCCSPTNTVHFNFPTDQNLQCAVVLAFSNASEGKCTNPFSVTVFGPDTDGTVDIVLDCRPGVQSNSFYTINAHCNTIGAPPECITQP